MRMSWLGSGIGVASLKFVADIGAIHGRTKVAWTTTHVVGHSCFLGDYATTEAHRDNGPPSGPIAPTMVRWHSHPQSQVMRDSLQLVIKEQPKTVILENVLGFGDIAKGDDKSPLDLAMQTLRDGGYDAICVQVDLRTWVNVARPRLQRV